MIALLEPQLPSRYLASGAILMGEAFPVQDLWTGLRVAFRFTPDLRPGSRVADALARIRHVNLARLHDVGRVSAGDQEWRYHAWRHVPGQPLSRLLRAVPAGTVSLGELLGDALEALEHLHANGIIHGNPCDANLLVDAVPRGPAAPRHRLVLTQTMSTPDTSPEQRPEQSAPERSHGAPASILTDLYTVGRAFLDLLDQQQDVDPLVRDVATRLCRQEPDERFPSAAAALEQLGRLPLGNAALSLRARTADFCGNEALLQQMLEVCRRVSSGDPAPVILISAPEHSGPHRLLETLTLLTAFQGLPSVLLEDLPGAPCTALPLLRSQSGSPAARSDAFARALAVTGDGVLVALPNAGTSSQDTLETLAYLGRSGRPIIPVLALGDRATDEGIRGTLRGLLPADRLVELTLAPWNLDQCSAYLQAVQPGQRATPGIARHFLERTGGLQGEVVEMMAALAEQGSMTGGRQPDPADILALAVGDERKAAFRRTLKQLSPRARRLARMVALAEPVPVGVLSVLLELEAVEHPLEEAIRAGIVRVADEEAGLTPTAVREVLCSECTDADRARAHGTIARWSESRGIYDSRWLEHRLDSGELTSGQLAAARLAVRELVDAGEIVRAAGLLDRIWWLAGAAAGASQPEPLLLRISEERMSLHAQAGHLHLGLAAAGECLRLAAPDSRSTHHARLFVASAMLSLGRMDEAEEEISRLQEQGLLGSTLLQLHGEEALLAISRGDEAGAMQSLREGHVLLNRISRGVESKQESLRARAHLLGQEALVLRAAGAPGRERATAWFRSVRAHSRAGSGGEAFGALVAATEDLVAIGRLDRARRLALRLMRSAPGLGRREDRGRLLVLMGEISFQRQDLGSSASLLLEALHLLERESGAEALQSEVLVRLAHVELQSGRVQAARGRLARARRAQPTHRTGRELRRLMWVEAELCCADGELERGAEMLQHALDLRPGDRHVGRLRTDDPEQGEILLQLVSVLLARGDLSSALRYASEGMRAAGDKPWPSTRLAELLVHLELGADVSDELESLVAGTFARETIRIEAVALLAVVRATSGRLAESARLVACLPARLENPALWVSVALARAVHAERAGNLASARAELESAIAGLAAFPRHRRRLWVTLRLAHLESAAGRFLVAMDSAAQARELARVLGARQQELLARKLIIDLYRRVGDPLAEPAIGQAHELLATVTAGLGQRWSQAYRARFGLFELDARAGGDDSDADTTGQDAAPRTSDLEQVLAAMVEGRDLAELAKLALRSMLRQVGGQRGTLWLAEDSEGGGEFYTTQLAGGVDLGRNWPATILDHVVRSQEPILAVNATSDPRLLQLWPESQGARVAATAHAESVIAIPVSSLGRPVGAVYLDHERRGVFTPRHERIAEVLTAQFGLILELARRDQALRRRMAELPAAHLLLDIEGRVLEANRAALTFFELRRDQIEGRLLTELVSGVGDLPATDTRAHLELHYRQPGERSRVLAAELDAASPAGRRVLVGIDVSEERREARKQQSLRELEAIGRATRGVVHDLSNLMTSIQGYAELLRMNTQLPAYVTSDADRILEAVRNARSVCNALLDIARGHSTPIREEELLLLTRQAVEVIRGACPAGVELGLELPAEPIPIMLPGLDYLRSVQNLVMNAYEATPPGGRVTVRLIHSGSRALLQVTDTGSGIAAEIREHMFKPHATTKVGGSGLGLAIVHRFATDQGGTLDFETGPTGTEMWLEFPIRPPAASGS